MIVIIISVRTVGCWDRSLSVVSGVDGCPRTRVLSDAVGICVAVRLGVLLGDWVAGRGL